MTTTASPYELLGVPPTCSDNELRSAYRRAIFEHHPDRNPHQMEAATVKTQQLVSAYAELQDLRQGKKITAGGYEFTVRYSFVSGVDIKDIAHRKAGFRNEWEKFWQNPTDPIRALRLVHAAFRAEGQDSITNLLLNPILIDSAPLLLSLVQEGAACGTLIRWSGVLQQSQRAREAVQILEDALATRAPLPSVANELRNLHYAWAQYSDPTTGSKATPQIRIEHLRRILELGFKYDYIYKYLAEAYHDLEDDEQARAYLRQAHELNPELSGVVRLSRALGLSESPEHSLRNTKSPSKHKDSHSEQNPIPSVLDRARRYRAKNPPGRAHREAYDSYLRARVGNQHSAAARPAPQELLAQAEKASKEEAYGRARVLLEDLLAIIEQSGPMYLDATVLLARSCAQMNDVRTYVEVIRPILPRLPEESRGAVSQEVASWLWNDLFLEQYTPINDEAYRLALDIHLELALVARTPDDVLKNLRSLTRWLELLGADGMVQWMRQLIRTEAPGTWYVDKPGRWQYIRNADLSPYMRDCLSSVDEQARAYATRKLKQLLGSAHALQTAEPSLEDN